jgi:GNAT superfamily N-acetyltransferase
VTDRRIRGANEGDRDAIEGVTLAAYQQYAAVMPALWERYRENILVTLAAAPSGTQIVAEKDGHVVGSVLLYPAGTVITSGVRSTTLPFPEVRLLAVAPSVRGQGMGALLMEECVRRARTSRAKGLTLHTTEVMQAAMRLYSRMGFRRAPELDFQPVPGVSIMGYRLDLP